jgi:transposase InsO family protein
MRTKERWIHQYVVERFDPGTPVPSYWTLRRVWVEWFGPGGARQRYVRSAAAAPSSGRHVVVHRPGQVVALDTTVLPVKVREHMFGDAVSVHLTIALDVYTRSIVAFRLTLVSDTSIDVAMLLRDVMMPLPLREGWGEDMEWPYPGVPAAVVAEFAGHKVAGLPFFAPETITVDHGSVYKNHHLVEVERVIGANILPARVLRPTDKQSVERSFGGIQSLLFEFLLGYQGVDVADRGADPEQDAVLTIAQMEHLIASWVVKVWQNRRMGEYAPCWDPGGQHSPNSLFASAMGQGGFSLQIPKPELYYQLLPSVRVKIDDRRGVKVKGLWFDGPALDPYRGEHSGRGGQYRDQWAVHYDKRDPRYTFFQDPGTHRWSTLRWVGLPPEGEVPAFGDVRREELLRTVKEAGLEPKTDAELLPALLDLVGGLIPVDQWPTQMTAGQRRQHAREHAQAATAATDRPAAARAEIGTTERGPDKNVVELQWPQRARQAEEAVDAERRRRREAAVTSRPVPPPLLRDALRGKSIFRIPDDDAEPNPIPDPGDGVQGREPA